MSQPEQFENSENKKEETMTDPYTSESSEDIYNTPDVLQSGTEESIQAEEEKDTQGLFSGNQQVSADPYRAQQNPNTYAGNGQYGNYNSGNNPYGGSNQYGSNNNGGQYGNYNSGNNPYGGSNQYGSNNNGGQYRNYNSGNNPYGGSNQYGSNSNGGQYGNYNSGNNPYGGSNNNGSQYGNYNSGNNPYGGNHNGNQYGNGQYGNGQYNNQPYGVPPYGGNVYSPYAAPQKKSHTGLIIGIVIAVIVLFLVAVFALAYKAVTMVTKEQRIRERIDSDDYNFDDDYDYHHDEHDYDYDDYDYDDYDYDDYDYGYDDDYGYDYDYDYDYDSDEYYTLHDDLKYDLSYSAYFENYEYATDNENIYITVTYPVIEGDDIPNLDKINEALMEECDYFTDYYEEELKDFIGDDGYFEAYSLGYVTYMDEKKMSVVFSENVYTDYYDSAYLYCINIDLENGVVLDNEQLLSLDDDFSVEFRQRSDIQNGEINYLTLMTDQEITDYFNSSDIIVFYTPQGMEIGFNYEEGWVTVTYDEEYQQYLKIF